MSDAVATMRLAGMRQTCGSVAASLTLLFLGRVWAGWTSGNCFTAFVGANLFQSGFTKFCPLDMILKKLGVPESTGNSCA